MAIFNEILVGRYNRALQKLFAIKGSPPLRQLGGELLPVISIFRGVEDRYLESWDRFGIVMQAAGGVGQFSAVRIRNPAGSNVIAVFEKILLTGNAVQQYQAVLGVQGSDLTPVGSSGIRLDARGRQSPQLILSNSTNFVAAGTNLFILSGQSSVNYDYIWDENQEIALLPGDALTISTNVVNVNIVCNFMWRERFLEESERT